MQGIEIEALEKKSDERGWLIEAFRRDWLDKERFGQVHVSVAFPGKVRGNHYHTRKVEWFCVTTGMGLLSLKDNQTGETSEIQLGEDAPKTIKISPGITHAIKNIGEKEMVLLVYSDETFDPNDPDTIYEQILK